MGQNTNEIVTSFEALLKNYFESYELNPRERATKLGGGWVKTHYLTERTGSEAR